MMDLADQRATAHRRAGRSRRVAARVALAAGALALGALLAGCGGATREDLQRQIDGLRSDVLKARADASALGERLDAIELRAPRAAASAASAAAAAPPAPRAGEGDRPALDVVKLGPGGAPAAAAPTAAAPAPAPAPEDDGPPTVLRSAGKNIVQEGGPRGASTKKAPGSTPVDPAANQLDKATKATPRPSPTAAPALGAKK